MIHTKNFNSVNEAINTYQYTPLVASIKDSNKILYASPIDFGDEVKIAKDDDFIKALPLELNIQLTTENSGQVIVNTSKTHGMDSNGTPFTLERLDDKDVEYIVDGTIYVQGIAFGGLLRNENFDDLINGVQYYAYNFMEQPGYNLLVPSTAPGTYEDCYMGYNDERDKGDYHSQGGTVTIEITERIDRYYYCYKLYDKNNSDGVNVYITDNKPGYYFGILYSDRHGVISQYKNISYAYIADKKIKETIIDCNAGINNITIKGNIKIIDFGIDVESLSLSGDLKYIPSMFLFNQSHIEDIVLPEHIQYIGMGAFSNCSSLKSINIPNSVTSIGDSAFTSCTSLTSITLNDNILEIKQGCFANCISLTSLTLPSNLTEISSASLAFCQSITSLNIHNNIKTIAIQALAGIGLESIVIPNSVTSIGYGAFYECGNLTSVTLSNTLKEIPEHCFKNCSNLSSIELPDSVTAIRDNAFENAGLTSINISKVNVIGEDVFYGCTNLSSIIISQNLTKLPIRCFGQCPITSINIPNGVKSLGGACLASTNITSVTIPSSVTYIEGSSFYNCKNLRYIDLGNNITSIEIYTFSDCISLTSITIPNTVTRILNASFESCSSLSYINMGNNIEYIDSYTFNRCTSLTSITIPSSVTNLGKGTFNDCSSLTSITIPSSVTKVGKNAFKNCEITSLTLNEGLETIDSYAFGNCWRLAGSTIVLPSTLTSIVQDSFAGCFDEDEAIGIHLRFTSTQPPTLTRTGNYWGFGDVESVEVPSGYKQAYIEAWQDVDFSWDHFGGLENYISEYTE